ncbi:MAG TPA: histidine--tRNA ligase [Acidimicrobiia bacterium]|nr:histidine--tRNA ligase [Acidimicrobiia bacterium]
MSADRDVFRAPKGMLDVLPPESARWSELVDRFAARTARFGYGLVVTPILEHHEVFQRVGETTDVVSKEMYAFDDRGGRRLALRPEGTAPVVRAYVQHRPVTPWKVWYVAPNFRAEQPQAGRYRQHWQLGAEVLGIDDPDVDVEIIDLLHGFLADLGLRDTRLLVNSMGDAPSRERYREVLLAYWRANADVLGAEIERAEANPLRILDSKRADWTDLLEHAPQLGEYLTDESAAHFARVQTGLRALGIDFEIQPRLVRGFDYYTGTVFEIASGALDAAQNAIAGGGRYDRLAEEMGGPPTPSIGFGAGIERILLACSAEGVLADAGRQLDAFVVDATGGAEATVVVHELRAAGLRADRAYGGRSVKKQWGVADRSGARFGVMVAPRELEQGRVVVKDLESGEQVEVRRAEVAAWLRTRQEGDSR